LLSILAGFPKRGPDKNKIVFCHVYFKLESGLSIIFTGMLSPEKAMGLTCIIFCNIF